MREVTYGEAIGTKYPEWIVMINTVDGDGRADTMPAGWCMVASGSPPMLAIGVGHTRYTHELITQSKEFVISFPAVGMGEAAAFCGSHSGRDTDKFAETDLVALPAKIVAAPLIAGCVANFECKLAGQVESGDHTVFVGEVVASHVDDEAGPRLVNFGGVFAAARPAE